MRVPPPLLPSHTHAKIVLDYAHKLRSYINNTIVLYTNHRDGNLHLIRIRKYPSNIVYSHTLHGQQFENIPPPFVTHRILSSGLTRFLFFSPIVASCIRHEKYIDARLPVISSLKNAFDENTIIFFSLPSSEKKRKIFSDFFFLFFLFPINKLLRDYLYILRYSITEYSLKFYYNSLSSLPRINIITRKLTGIYVA